MSNNAYLLNTPSLVSDLNALEGEWLGVASGCYRIPAPWFYMFDSADLGSSTISYQASDDDAGEREYRTVKAVMLNPATSVAEAKSRLMGASRMFEASAVDASVVREYWDQAIAHLDSLPFPYLTIDAAEILLMQDVKESAEEFARAFGNEAQAVELVKKFSCFVDQDSSTHSEALDGGFHEPDYRMSCSRTAEARHKWDAKLDQVPLAWKIA
jgi:hypothetical protein